jgi:hypothetical protein
MRPLTLPSLRAMPIVRGSRTVPLLTMAMFLVAGIGAVGVASAASGHAADQGTSVGPAFPLMSTTTGTSHSWSGYAISTAKGAVTFVGGGWVEPAFHGTCSGSTTFTEAGFWVGIDGWGGSTVEQTGTAVECFHGTVFYYAWTEFYPAKPTVLSMTIAPGDVMDASVSYHKAVHNYYTLFIQDITTSAKYSTSNSLIKAARSSAEWIAEAPSSGGKTLPLTDFGSVTFTACTVTISGHHNGISAFANVRINMVHNTSTALKASTGSLQFSGTKFRVVWKSAGP